MAEIDGYIHLVVENCLAWELVGSTFFLSAHSHLRASRRVLVGSSLIYAVRIFLFALSPICFFSIALLAIVGSMQISYRVLARAIIQEECPDHMLGRAISLFFLTGVSVRPVPSVLAAWRRSCRCHLQLPLAPWSAAWCLGSCRKRPTNPNHRFD